MLIVLAGNFALVATPHGTLLNAGDIRAFAFSVLAFGGFFVFIGLLGYRQDKIAEVEEHAKKSAELKRLATIQATIKATCGHKAIIATVLGGSGSAFPKEQIVFLSCANGAVTLTIRDTGLQKSIRFVDILRLDIEGPGTVRSNAGVIGGGFGVAGALEGMAIATVLNALTSKSKTNTFVRLATRGSETYLHTSSVDPKELRMILSAAFVHLETAASSSSQTAGTTISDEIKKLHAMLQDGVLTNEEFAAAKNRLLQSPVDTR